MLWQKASATFFLLAFLDFFQKVFPLGKKSRDVLEQRSNIRYRFLTSKAVNLKVLFFPLQYISLQRQVYYVYFADVIQYTHDETHKATSRTTERGSGSV